MKVRGLFLCLLTLLITACSPRADLRSQGVDQSSPMSFPVPAESGSGGGLALDGRIRSWSYALQPVDAIPSELDPGAWIVSHTGDMVEIAWRGPSCTPSTLDDLRFDQGPTSVTVRVEYPRPIDCPAVIAFGLITIRTDGSLDPDRLIVEIHER